MSKNQFKFSPISYPGLGLVFGTIIGIIFGPSVFGDMTLGLVLGSTLGLIFGAVAYMWSKNKNDGENS